jgi:chorismate synthase
VQDAFRPSHADYTYTAKYGFRDYRGGGRSSARETACRVVAGAVAQLLLRQSGLPVQITASITEVGGSTDIESTILQAKQAGDTVGGIISCTITGVPAGWGEPVFDKLQAKLAAAMLSINAAKGFDYGMGFDMVAKRGSQVNDIFETDADGRVVTRTNYSGGIQGGISNGMPIYFRVAFKPVATLMQPQDTIDAQGNPIRLQVKGRHDACVLPRALPIVESMAALVLADAYLLQRNSKL